MKGRHFWFTTFIRTCVRTSINHSRTVLTQASMLWTFNVLFQITRFNCTNATLSRAIKVNSISTVLSEENGSVVVLRWIYDVQHLPIADLRFGELWARSPTTHKLSQYVDRFVTFGLCLLPTIRSSRSWVVGRSRAGCISATMAAAVCKLHTKQSRQEQLSS